MLAMQATTPRARASRLERIRQQQAGHVGRNRNRSLIHLSAWHHQARNFGQDLARGPGSTVSHVLTGISGSDIKVGVKVTVEGYVSREDDVEMRAERITSGRQGLRVALMGPGTALLSALQEGSFASADARLDLAVSGWSRPSISSVSRSWSVRLSCSTCACWAYRSAFRCACWPGICSPGRSALLLIVPTGTLMFASDAVNLVGNRAFVSKMPLLMLAATNAAAFHVGVFRTLEMGPRHGRAAGRAAARRLQC